MPSKPRPSVRDAWRDLAAAVKAPANPPPDDAPAAPAKRKWSTLPSARFKGTDGELQLYPDAVDHVHGMTKESAPLGTITSVTVEDGADLEARITATRLVLVGVFALAWRKRTGGEKFLVVESTDTTLLVTVDRKDVAKAQKFAAAVRSSAKRAS
ncbi:hypothetical protein GCM10009592_26380 [Brachybacterium rhamnosum]|uniref:Uncharacterized protein n=1 Tax=Brachybacterium rhamnosum TaxID=173361 RepID=A0ABW4Q096_9MICO